MPELHRLLDLLNYVLPRDFLSAWKLPAAVVAALFLRRKRRNLWIVSEDPMEARDNGYWFFRYVREHHPEQDCVYAIRRRAPDYPKVSALGETVEYGSLRHWVLYLTSTVQISSQKSGDPNAPVFYALQVYGLLKNRRLFLQHGVTKDDVKWLYYSETKISRFLCGAAPEYEFVRSRFGYPDGAVRYTGLCRFDGLHDFRTEPDLVLIMPSWRNWLTVRKDRMRDLEGPDSVAESQYIVEWQAFLEDKALKELSERYHVRFLFYPHRNMQQYLSLFPSGHEHVELCARERYDVQGLLKRAALLITDYSSVFFDMVYMKKPVIFYQFDLDRFREGQYPEGYFHYSDNPFGMSCRDRVEVFALLRETLESGCAVSKKYLETHERYFPLYDAQNTRRAWEAAMELGAENHEKRRRNK